MSAVQTRRVVLVAAVIASGLQAGTYYGFSVGVMPALAAGNDLTYLAAMHQINTVIVNSWFLLTFLGAPLLAALAAVLTLKRPRVLACTTTGFAFALATFVITVSVNAPLTDTLLALGTSDPAAARQGFEQGWSAWNTGRAVTSTLAVVCLGWALGLLGTSTQPAAAR
jgi:uncharacterized membrane protein